MSRQFHACFMVIYLEKRLRDLDFWYFFVTSFHVPIRIFGTVFSNFFPASCISLLSAPFQSSYTNTGLTITLRRQAYPTLLQINLLSISLFFLFLVATKQNYTSLCRSVCRSVFRSVDLSVTSSSLGATVSC